MNDSVRMTLIDGEFWLSADLVDLYGREFLNRLNEAPHQE